MPPYVAPSPLALDQRSLESSEELAKIRHALIAITDGIDEGVFVLLLTDPLRAFIRDCEITFDWSKIRIYPRLEAIYRLLLNFGLQQAGVESLNLSTVRSQFEHPLPVGTELCPIANEWALEIGKLYSLHKSCCSARPFVGVACISAFSGGVRGKYQEGCTEFLPLVGPKDTQNLDDAYVWDLRSEWRDRIVTFDAAKRNVHAIGGTFHKAKGTSHNQVTFREGRTWPLDSNLGEIPDEFLSELTIITGFTLPVIKYALIEGELPPKRNRFKMAGATA